ncbi:MAG: hypothetical protein GWP91_18120 [Rhodobacterales bacterium]|nr:hypothetical protein [Rhodobacterales bacterium]
MRHWYPNDNSSEMLAVSIVLIMFMMTGLYLYMTIHSLANRPVKTVDDADSCIACGSSTDRWDVAPGVYTCLCGYEGGPGMRDWEWSKQVAALAKLSPEKRAARRKKHAGRVRDVLTRVPDTLAGMETHLITAGAAFNMTNEGRNAAHQAYSAAARLARDARHLLHEAIADAEVVRHLTSGEGMMDDWRTRVDGRHGTMSGYGPEVAESIKGERRRIQKLVKDLGAVL